MVDTVVPYRAPMATVEIRPATAARFPDVAALLGPKNPASNVCWCLQRVLRHRVPRLGAPGGTRAADTDAVAGGFPRVLMRLEPG